MTTMMASRWETITNRLHVAVAVLLAWLILTSPWLSMLRRVPSRAGFLDYAHVVLGLATLPLAVVYALACIRGQRWRLYFPWASGDLGAVGRDLLGLLHGNIPAAEGGGLFAVIEGLGLLLLVVTAATGAAWFASQGSDLALAWRGYHLLAARVLIGLVVVHLVAVSLHLLEFVREG